MLIKKIVVDKVEYTVNKNTIFDMRFIAPDISDETVVEIPEILDGNVITDISRRNIELSYRDDRNKPSLTQIRLKKLVLPPSISTVQSEAFSYINCDELVWSENCCVIPHLCFFASAIQEIHNISHVHTIEENAFENCLFLRKFRWPDECYTINISTFLNCVALEEIHNTEHITRIGFRAFTYCRSLKDFYWPSECEMIPDSCFYGCGKLENVYNLNNVVSIADDAFVNCSLLDELHFEKLQMISTNAFSNTSLKLDLSRTAMTNLDNDYFKKICINTERVILPYFY